MNPHFPIPSDLIPSYLPLKAQLDMPALPLQYLLLASQLTQPTSAPDGYTMIILSCLRDLWVSAESIESRIIPSEPHDDLSTDNDNEREEEEESIGLLLNPIAHRLLSVSQSASTQRSPSPSPSYYRHHHRASIASAIRLGQILWIIAVKRRYRAYPGSLSSSSTTSPVPVYAKPLLTLLTDERVWAGDAGLPSVRLWLLVLSSISLSSSSSFSSYPNIEERTAVVDGIRDVMRRWELDSWSDVMGYVCQMPWVDSLFSPLVTGLKNEINIS
ncbi:hypothetical protein BJY01DRAFT_225023 [Aspergillus pseudoustus]|uniref:Fungal-specific transcription factor domain-containing protein n=1 Tax=Aspergillus pseudoustus TaxID=1810923 RepID=A0ABR4J0T4_9EURO